MAVNRAPKRPRSRTEILQGAGLVQSLVSMAFGVTLEELQAPSRSKAHIAFARQCAMYLCHVTLGMSLSEIAMAFRRDRTTVSHACHLVEDARDDEDLDARLSCLEASVNNFSGDMSAFGEALALGDTAPLMLKRGGRA
ncbi:MAG: helix-turn-helix domain-containing protein [Pseudomonadota bacterium]